MLKVIFAGTPDFALPTLTELLHSPHQILGVYTQPDKAAGRGKKLTASPVKNYALQHQLPLYQPLTLKDAATQQQLQALGPDVLINVAYGLLLPESVLKIPKFACINLHPSLLPKWRGAAPIQRSILAGDSVTGITIMQMDAGLDTGAIYLQEELPIDAHETSGSLSQKTARRGAQLLMEVLDRLEHQTIQARPQGDQPSSYAAKITKDEGAIDWNYSALVLERMVRAFNPWPVAYFRLAEEPIRVWEAQVIDISSNQAPPGTIVSIDQQRGIGIMTGSGVLLLTKIQFPGRVATATSQILNAPNHPFQLGRKLLVTC